VSFPRKREPSASVHERKRVNQRAGALLVADDVGKGAWRGIMGTGVGRARSIDTLSRSFAAMGVESAQHIN
jgi:hypothetical protein